jgi:hypothetical protein
VGQSRSADTVAVLVLFKPKGKMLMRWKLVFAPLVSLLFVASASHYFGTFCLTFSPRSISQ